MIHVNDILSPHRGSTDNESHSTMQSLLHCLVGKTDNLHQLYLAQTSVVSDSVIQRVNIRQHCRANPRGQACKSIVLSGTTGTTCHRSLPSTSAFMFSVAKRSGGVKRHQ